MSDHGHVSSYEGHKERRTGKIREAFSKMHRTLAAGCWLAGRLHQLKASTTMDLGISIFLLFVQCVAWRNLDLLIKTRCSWSVICPHCCLERWSWVGDNNPSRSRLLSIWSKEV